MNFKRVLSLLLLVAAIVCAAFLAAVLLSDDAEAIDPYDPDLKVAIDHTSDDSGLPGDKVRFYMTLFNKGANDDTYTITNSAIPAGWTISISPNEVSVDEDKEEDIIVSVTIPTYANDTDSVDISITATSQNDPDEPPAKTSLLLTCDVDQEFDVELTTISGEPTTKKIDPGDPIYFLLNVSNVGNGDDTIAVSKVLPSGKDDWVVIFNFNSITLKRDKYSLLNISVTPPSDEDAGQMPVDITLTSEDTKEKSSQTLVPEVNYIPDFIVLPYGGNQKRVETKESVTYGVTVDNKGNDEDSFKFTIRPGSWSDDGWTASLDYNSITVSKAESINLESLLTVNAPDGNADQEANIIVNVTSEDGTLTKTLNTRTKILQDYDPAINIVGGTTKDVDPGEDVEFDIQVFNNGNGEDEISLKIRNDDQVPGSWGSFSDSAVTLQAKTNTTITLTVTPPSDAAYLDEGYTLQIFGISDDGENESTLKTLKVSVNKKFDLSVTISGASTKKVDPDATVDYTVNVKNKGNAEDTILLTLYGEDNTWKPEWGAIVSSVDLVRDASTTVTLSVTVPDDASKADYKIGIKGSSDEDPSQTPVNKTTEVIVSVNQTYEIIITIPAAQKSVDVDSMVDYDIEVKNDGTGDDILTLEVTVYPDSWLVNFNQSTLELGAKETAKVTMTLETPSSEDSITFFVNFTATSQNAPDLDPVVEIGSTITTVNQTYEFDIVPSPDYSSVQPGDTVEFNISFQNKGTGDDHIKVVKSGDFPDTWTVSIASDVSINRDETVYKTLTVSIDDETLKDEYHITLTGTSDDDPHIPAFIRQVNITINVEQEFNLTASISIDTKSVDPFPQEDVDKVTFTFTVNNTGTGLDKFEFNAEFDATPTRKNGWSVAFDPETIDLGVKEEEQVNAIITVPYKENIATYGLTITVTSFGDGSVTQSLKVFIDMNQTYSISMISDFLSQQITPSEVESDLREVNFTVTVTNDGTGEDKFYLELFGLPDGWFLNLPGNTGIIAMGEAMDAVLNLKVPGLENPATYSLELVATSDGRSDVIDNITLQVIVDELHSLDVTTPEPIKKGDVNNRTNFVIEVTNKGTGVDTFTFDYRDVPDDLTVSFPDGTGTEEIGPNNKTTKTVRVWVEDKTPKAKFSFNITVTSDEDQNIEEVIELTVDVNQSYSLLASLIAQPPNSNVDPGETSMYTFELTNDGTGTDSLTVEVPGTLEGGEVNVPIGWVVTPIPFSFDLISGEKREVDIEVQVDENAEPENVTIEIWFYYHDSKEVNIQNIRARVNQTYDISTNLNFALLEIFPGYNDSAILTVKNTGTGVDFYKIEISNIPDITAKVEPSLTPDVYPDKTITIAVSFRISGGMEPDTVKFWINVTSQGADEKDIEVIETSSIDIQIKETYGVSVSQETGIYTVSPTHDFAGERSFDLTITNDGTSEDTFNFKFLDDNDTLEYKKWLKLPDSIVDLAPKSGITVSIDITVDRENIDGDAISDGNLKDVKFYVYSKGADENNVAVEGETTKEFLCQIDIEEYRYAAFTSVTPPSVTMGVGETIIINVTIKNEGNGDEEYSFIKDGKSGSGDFMNWYDFNVTKIVIGPGNSTQVSIDLTPETDAPVGTHDLEFHAESETTYDTDDESFRVEIEEKFGGKFVSGSDKRSDPGESINMEVTVANTGNDDHYFYLDDPNVPEGWTTSWSGGSQKSISADSSDTFTVRVDIPTDYTKAEAGLYQFKVTGDYETESSGRLDLPGFAYLNLTINTLYGVSVTADDPADIAKPGETVIYNVDVRNTGNTNETYALSIITASGFKDAKNWAEITGPGVDPSTDSIRILTGVTAVLNVVVDIPEFTPENEDAEMGLFGMKFQAKSSNESEEKDDITLELQVEEIYQVRLWSDIPGKNETLKEMDDTEMTYTMYVRNLGNTDDDILVTVPNDEFSGDKRDWEVKFGTQPSQTLGLKSLAQEQVTLKVIIDKSTDEGQYTLNVRAESKGDTSVYVYSIIYINLSKAQYGLELEKVLTVMRYVNPADESEIEFKFTLTNTGNQDDSYNVEVETPLGSGTYKEWFMEFDNKDDERVDEVNVPTDLKGQTENILNKNGRVDITLFVKVASDEDEGVYEEISISATSDNDNTQVQYIYFNLTVILPNIRLSADLEDFNIDPDDDIEEDDSIDINLRVYNDGNAETDSFYVFFYNGKKNSPNENAGSNYLAFEKIDNIPANSYFDVLATWDDIEGGDNDIYAIADKPIRSGIGATKDPKGNFMEDGSVLESRENDNSISIAQKYEDAVDLRPDLTIIRVEFDDYDEGEKTTVTVTVGNVGSAKALRGSADVKLKIGGDAMKDKTGNREIPTIDDDIEVDDDIDMEFVWDIDEAKNFTVKASVKHPDDSNSGNDRLNTYVVTKKEETGIGPGGGDVTTIIAFGGIVGVLLLVVVMMMMKMKKLSAEGGPPARGPPPKGKGPKGKGKPPAKKPGAKGPPPKPGAKRPPKPGEKPITPPGKGRRPPGARPPGKPGPGGKRGPPGGRPGGPPGKSAKPCPKCRTPIPITSAKRPLKLVCPKCGASGTINK